MRIAVVTAGVLGVAVAAACGAAAARDRAAAPRGPVPWVNRPAPVYVVPQPALLRYPTTAPLCRASQLRVTGFTGAAAGSVVQRFTFHNLSPRTCLLRGFARISGVSPAGRRVELHPEPVDGDIGAGSIIPADVPPGRSGQLLMTGSDMCVRMRRYTDLTFRLPGGGSVDSARSLLRPCSGWQMTGLGLPQRYPSPPPPPARGAGALRVALVIPAQPRVVSALRYVAVLSNPTRWPIALRPCPRYEELLFAPGLAVRREFWLNCAGARPIPAGGSERFAMVLPLGRPVPLAGMAKLSWVLGLPGCPTAVTSPALARSG
jgi:hypothetical protein